MRRYNKRKESLSVSLFPFLAVLICTFGVLIVLLVIVVKAADQQAEVTRQEVEQDCEVELETLNANLEYQQLRVEGLRAVRPDLLNQLQQARQQRANLQAAIDSLYDEAKQINEQIRLVNNEAEIASQQPDPSELTVLQQQLEEATAELDQRRRSTAFQRPTKYSVVPHNGSGGTQRRPIYIECKQNKLVIQPYAIDLTSADFVRPIVANNPLDAALIAVREYFVKNNLESSGQTPYPLLIVRPNGAESYGVARHAIRSWDEEFGYELISADKELDFGQADPQLKEELIAAIAAARHRQNEYVAQQMLLKAAGRQHGGSNGGAALSAKGGVPGLQASSRLGGFVGPDGNVAANRKNNLQQSNQGNFDKEVTTAQERTQVKGSTDSKTMGQSESDGGEQAGQGAMASIAQRRGNNWALPNRNDSNSTGYRRPVIVSLTQRGIVFDAVSGSADETRIDFTESTAESAEKMVEAIWDQIDAWGVAGVNAYWKPELVVRVAPNAQNRFQQLKQVLIGSGLEIREAVR